MKTKINLEGSLKLTLSLISGVTEFKTNPFLKFEERINGLTPNQRFKIEDAITKVLNAYNDMRDAELFSEEHGKLIYPRVRDCVKHLNHQLEFYLQTMVLVFPTHIEFSPFNAN